MLLMNASGRPGRGLRQSMKPDLPANCPMHAGKSQNLMSANHSLCLVASLASLIQSVCQIFRIADAL